MAAPYVPPSTEGKPFVPAWVPPPATKADLEFANLHTIDLALLDSPDEAVVNELVQTAKTAIKEDGFLYLVDYGISLEQLHRQFSLAQYLHSNISNEDKERLLWDPESGLFAGYKPRFGWKRQAGKVDGIEHFNFYADEFKSLDKVPTCIHPFMDEIRAFSEYLTGSVNRRLLKLLSRVLELPDEYLWEKVQAREMPVNQGYIRHALFHPLIEETKSASGGLRMHGHCDYGTTTMLFSVPITCLQIWQDERWKYVKYNPGSLVINIGETLEILSGGHFKATRHRVFEAPEDQRHEQRLSIVLFNASEGDLQMTPAIESPLIQREGCLDYPGVYSEFKRMREAGLPVPTNRQWREVQIANMREVTDTANNRIGADQVVIDGKKYTQREFLGVKVVLPV
ncbi:hypothetical protein BCR39DRAFT_516500 [Naematelia encephala]|uniref:Fe2OG dioxygenase domain-containing protein n=1 Tax=Naematelia encephala TaxID=71784 RepID=A0A1Y2BJW6_9TREE|nr:hypothetical protein BCR39DRAFT_516500 [Naematelia encephala]